MKKFTSFFGLSSLFARIPTTSVPSRRARAVVDSLRREWGYLRHSFLVAGTYFIAVSNDSNFQYNPLTGNGDLAGGQHATGTYRLVLHSLSLWHNASNPYDVDNDNFVSPLDALVIINFLNSQSNGQGEGERVSTSVPMEFIDDYFSNLTRKDGTNTTQKNRLSSWPGR